MPQAAHNSAQEYWCPADPVAARVAPILARDLCACCGAEYPARARFCPDCGSQRAAKPETTRRSESADIVDLERVGRRHGFSLTCLAFVIAGLICMVIAAAMGTVHKTETLIAWQAVQLWRIEWLLGGIVALLVGLLLKTTE